MAATLARAAFTLSRSQRGLSELVAPKLELMVAFPAFWWWLSRLVQHRTGTGENSQTASLCSLCKCFCFSLVYLR